MSSVVGETPFLSICQITATASVRVMVYATTSEEAAQIIEMQGIRACEFDGDEFMNIADYEFDIQTDPKPLLAATPGRRKKDKGLTK